MVYKRVLPCLCSVEQLSFLLTHGGLARCESVPWSLRTWEPPAWAAALGLSLVPWARVCHGSSGTCSRHFLLTVTPAMPRGVVCRYRWGEDVQSVSRTDAVWGCYDPRLFMGSNQSHWECALSSGDKDRSTGSLEDQFCGIKPCFVFEHRQCIEDHFVIGKEILLVTRWSFLIEIGLSVPWSGPWCRGDTEKALSI